MKKLKQSRAASFIAIALVYILAATLGIMTYSALDMPWWLALLISDAVSTAVTFVFSLIFKNASVYDPYWSVQPPLIIIAFSLGREMTPFGMLLIAVITFWGVRLTANWAYTFSNLNHQDWRYTLLKENTGIFYPIINFVGIHMVPTLVVYACTAPAVYALVNGLKANLAGVLFLCLSLAAATMQGVADIQMHLFRKRKTGRFIRTGLWKYSRHPNYLGEILMWWGVGLSVFVCAGYEWYLLMGAIANTLLFLTVSIPMADRRQSRKEGFEEYRAQTRMLIPLKIH